MRKKKENKKFDYMLGYKANKSTVDGLKNITITMEILDHSADGALRQAQDVLKLLNTNMNHMFRLVSLAELHEHNSLIESLPEQWRPYVR
jgi:hypothetical protein